jgi:hypothetical protein
MFCAIFMRDKYKRFEYLPICLKLNKGEESIWDKGPVSVLYIAPSILQYFPKTPPHYPVHFYDSNLLYLSLIKITQNIEFKSSFIKSPYKITRLNNLVDFRYYGY